MQFSRWNNYEQKNVSLNFEFGETWRERAEKIEKHLESEYVVKPILMDSPYYFQRFKNKIGPGSLGRVLEKETAIALRCILDKGTEARVKEKFPLPESTWEMVWDFIRPKKQNSCHLLVIDALLQRIGEKMGNLFVNRYCSGIKPNTLVEIGLMLGSGSIWEFEGTRQVGITPTFCISGDSTRWCTDQYSIDRSYLGEGLEEAADMIHHVFSDNKDAEATLAALERVVKANIFEEITFNFNGMHRNGAPNRQWELAQTVYVRAMKKMMLKHKNLHVSKRSSVNMEADKLLAEVWGLYHYFTKDNKVYVPAAKHYTLKPTLVVEAKSFEYLDPVRQPDYYEEIPGQGPERINYTTYKVNIEKSEEWRKSFKHMDKFRDKLLEWIQEHKGSIGEPWHTLNQNRALTDIFGNEIDWFDEEGSYRYWEDALDRIFVRAEKAFNEDLAGLMENPRLNMDVERFKGLDDEGIMNLLVSEGNSKSKSKKQVGTIKRAIRDQIAIPKKMPKMEKKFGGWKMVPKKEEWTESKWKLLPHINNLLESKEKHADFVLHEYSPNFKIQVRNAKRYLRKRIRHLPKKDREYPRQLLNGANKQSRILRNKMKKKHKFERRTVRKENKNNSLHVARRKKEKILLDYVEKDRRDRRPKDIEYAEVDFDKYDFESINKQKLVIISMEVFWSRGNLGKLHHIKLKAGLNPKDRCIGSRKYRGLGDHVQRAIQAGF